MGKPLVAKKEIVLKYNVKNVWDIIVNNNDYKWQTDIKEIEMLENGKDWIEYYEINNNETKCIFIETIYIKNRIMNILAKIFWTLKKIQDQYFKDLEKKLYASDPEDNLPENGSFGA